MGSAALPPDVPRRQPEDDVLPIADPGIPGLRLRVRSDDNWGGVEILLEHGIGERTMQQLDALDLTTEEARWLRDVLVRRLGAEEPSR